MPCVRDILSGKSGVVVTVSPETDVLDAVRKMNQHRIGALVVLDAGAVVGMFTERDVLRLVGALRDVAQLRVGDVMTSNVTTAKPATDLEEISEIMRSRRIRHIPVVNTGELVGMVSMGDINAWSVQHAARQLEGLNEYIYGRA